MIKDLFEARYVEDACDEYVIYRDCKMLRDFGQAKANDSYELICVILEENKIEFYSSEDQDTPDFTHLYSLTYVKNS